MEERPLQTLPELLMKRECDLPMTGNEHIVVVRPQALLVQAEKFAKLPLDSITIKRSSTRLDRNSQTEMAEGVWYAKYGTLPQLKDIASVKEPTVLSRIVKSSGGRKSLRRLQEDSP